MENIEELERKYKELGEEIERAKKEKNVDRWVSVSPSYQSRRTVIDNEKVNNDYIKMPMVRVRNDGIDNDNWFTSNSDGVLEILDKMDLKCKNARVYLHIEKD
jgi:hypothetical protein